MVRPRQPTGLRALLEDVRVRCRRLSDEHRRAIPAEVVEERLGAILNTAADIFHDRAMQICFLLDQHKTLRFNELHRMLAKMSSRTLAAKLTMLQDQGLVLRRHFDESPPRVEYRLTRRGVDLVDLLFPAILHVSLPEASHA